MIIKFKAGRKNSVSCESYRQIIKSGDLKYDMADTSDDVIIISLKDGGRLIIDCDKKTGEFRLNINDDGVKIYD